MKNFLLLSSAFIILSCGDNPDLSSDDVSGTWYTENTEFTENSCDFSGPAETFFKFESSDDNIKISNCSDSTCAKSTSIGMFAFKTKMQINEGKTIDVGKTAQLDCNIKFEKIITIEFDDSETGSLVSRTITSTQGDDCTSIKDFLEKSSSETDKESAKILNNNCVVTLTTTIQKQ